jgi:hypothetical protein
MGFDKVIRIYKKQLMRMMLIYCPRGKTANKKDKITRIIDLNSLDKWTYTLLF